ncbi:hypothetical protein [Mycobacteroides abscessus]|uniref:hypothetical protein n=1 Tax=Mycobacteroides abscessus TaxID=36809 RepID=UPI000C25DEE2|nr:hypothetical protein [Mycobacteroides abscessus]
MPTIVSFGASHITALGAQVHGDHIVIAAADCSLSVLASLDTAEELASELNQAIADLRAAQHVRPWSLGGVR